MSFSLSNRKKLGNIEKALERVLSLGFSNQYDKSVQHLENDEQIMYQVGHHINIFNYKYGKHNLISKGEKVKRIHGFLLSKGKRFLAISEEKTRAKGGERYQVTIYSHGMDMKYKSLKVNTETPIISMSFSKNNNFLVGSTGSPENVILLWDLEKFKLISRRNFKRLPLQIRFSPFSHASDTHMTLSLLHPSCVRLYFVIENEMKQVDPIFSPSNQPNFACHTWYDYEKMLIGTKGGNVCIVEKGKITKSIKNVFLSHGSGIYAIALVERGFVCAGDGGYFTFFERSYDKNYFNQYKLFRAQLGVRIDGICVSRSEDNLICSCVDNTILYLNFNNVDIIKENEENFERLPVEFHSEVVLDAGVSIQKSLVVTVTKNTIRIWNYETKLVELRKDIPTPAHNGISSVSVHPCGTEILLSFNEKIVLYKIVNKDLFPCYDWHVRSCSCVKYSRGGHYFAASYGTRIMVISSLTYKKVVELEGHDGIIRSIVWSSHDQIISSCGDDGTVFVWKVHKKITKLGAKNVKHRQNHTRVSKVILNNNNNNNNNGTTSKKKGNGIVKDIAPGEKQKNENGEGEGGGGSPIRFKDRSTSHILETNQVENCELTHVVHEGSTGASAAIGSDNFLWCFTKRNVVQIDPRGYQYSTMVLSTVMKTLFIGTENGRILLHEWPLQNQHYKEYQIHCSRVVRLVLDMEERFLFSVGEDGSLFKFAIVFNTSSLKSKKKKNRKRRSAQKRCRKKHRKNRRCSYCNRLSESSSKAVSEKGNQDSDDDDEYDLEVQLRRMQSLRSYDKKWNSLESVTFIMKRRIEEMKENIINLREKMKQVEKDAKRQIEEEKMEKRQELNEIKGEHGKERSNFQNQIDEHRQRTSNKEKEARYLFKKLEKEHLEVISRYEEKFEKQNKMQSDLEQKLQINHENVVATYEDEIRKLKNQFKHQLHQVTEDNLGSKVERLRGFHKIEEEFWNIIKEFKTDQRKESKDFVWQIDVERYKYENEIARLKEEKKELEESQKNHKRDFDRVLEKVNSRNERIIAMTKELNERTEHTTKLEKKLDLIMKQIHDRQDQIDASSEKIDEQRKELTELEKLRFLLTFKFDRLKEEVQPVLEDIGELQEKLYGMDNELTFLKKRKGNMKDNKKKNYNKEKVLKENVKKLKQQYSEQDKFFNFLYDELFELYKRMAELRETQEKKRSRYEYLSTYPEEEEEKKKKSSSGGGRKRTRMVGKPFINGLRKPFQNKDYSRRVRSMNKDKKISLALQIELQNIIEKYRRPSHGQKTTSYGMQKMKKNTQLLEFERERDYLEQKMQSLQNTLVKKDHNYISDVHRKTSENSVLVKEINILRQDINKLEHEIRKEEDTIDKQNQVISKFQKVLITQMNRDDGSGTIGKNVYLPLLDDLGETFQVNKPLKKVRKRMIRKSKKIGKGRRRRRRKKKTLVAKSKVNSLERRGLTSVIGRQENRFSFLEKKRPHTTKIKRRGGRRVSSSDEEDDE